MFDTYCNNNVNTKITACSGGIYKTYKESWFERVNLKSERARDLLGVNCGDYYYGGYSGRERILGGRLVVIQMVVCGDMEVIAEIINKNDYDEYFETPREELMKNDN